MARTNRCDPWGRLNAFAEHGGLMGNRGILEPPSIADALPYSSHRWVICTLQSKGRTVRFADGGVKYTKLFFLDEASALAAGHRPCAQCSPKQYRAFKAAWVSANTEQGLSVDSPIADIDRVLHGERAMGHAKRRYDAVADELPDGAIFAVGDQAYLVWNGGHRRWSFAGYSAPEPAPFKGHVQVLTPHSIVRMLRTYAVRVHASADG